MAQPKAGKRTIGVIADEILDRKLAIKGLNKQVEALELDQKRLEAELQTAAEKEDQTKGGGKKSTWSIEPHTVPQVQDWDAFYEYIIDNKWMHLLNRRPTVKACQELWDSGKIIPGVEKFTSNKVTVKEV